MLRTGRSCARRTRCVSTPLERGFLFQAFGKFCRQARNQCCAQMANGFRMQAFGQSIQFAPDQNRQLVGKPLLDGEIDCGIELNKTFDAGVHVLHGRACRKTLQRDIHYLGDDWQILVTVFSFFLWRGVFRLSVAAQ